MKRKIILTTIVISVLALIFIFTGCSKPVATVNGFKIETSEVDFILDYFKEREPDVYSDPASLNTLKGQVIDSMIVDRLLEEYAAENNISVSDEEFNEELEKLKEGYETEAVFEQQLEDLGITLEMLKKDLRGQLLRNKIFNEYTSDVMVEEAAIKTYYDQNKETYFKIPEQAKLSHILIRFAPEDAQEEEAEELLSKEEAFEEITRIKEKIESGESFDELALAHSQDPGSATNAGDLGFVTKGQMVPEFEEAAFELNVGEVSPIVETVYGYHIIKMYEYNEETYMSFEESKAEIENFISYTHKNDKWEVFLLELKSKAEIVYSTQE